MRIQSLKRVNSENRTLGLQYGYLHGANGLRDRELRGTSIRGLHGVASQRSQAIISIAVIPLLKDCSQSKTDRGKEEERNLNLHDADRYEE